MDLALSRRRALRQRATDAEKLLWRLLRSRQLHHLKFRRQHPVGPYILDFYCASRRVALELDGGQHYSAERQMYDEKRTSYLLARGICVLRFSDRDMFLERHGVLERIEQVCKERGPSP